MMHDVLLAAVWYLALTGFGLAALPLSMRAFSRMPDAGILLARPLGWLLAGVVSWWLAFALRIPFSWIGIGLALAIVAGCSACVWRGKSAWLKRRLAARWRTALNGEIITLAVYAFVLYMRRNEPNIDHTEKPMDLMFLSGLINTRQIPPPDPWYLDGYINYHYGGYLLHSLPAKLTGILPEYAYNLSVAAVAAVAASVAFVLGRSLFGRCRWGAVTVLATLFAGNWAMSGAAFWREQMPASLYEWRWVWLWRSSRVIADPDGETINEFPFFSMMWADLHPHYSNIPFFLLAIAVVYAIYLASSRMLFSRMLAREWPLLAVGALTLAFLMPTNLFDFPTASLLLGACVIFAAFYHRFASRRDPRWFLHLAIAALPLVAYLAAMPFWLYFFSPLEGNPLRIASHRTDWHELFAVFGGHICAVVLYLGLTWGGALRRRGPEELGAAAALTGIVVTLFWGLTGHLAAALAPLLALALWFTAGLTALDGSTRSEARRRESFCLIACALAWSLIAGCEYFFIKDGYGIARMNTLFKFHFPAWLLMGVGLPPLLYYAVLRLPSSSTRAGGAAAALGLLAFSLIGPAYTAASFMRIGEDRPATLNGLAYMQRHQPHLYSMIEWIRKNAPRDAVLMEIPGGGYQLDSMVSAATGRRSVIGWVNHENVWRGRSADTFQRRDDILYALTTDDTSRARAIFAKYKPDYIVLAKPAAADMQQHVPRMLLGTFRSLLEPIQQEAGPYELFRVPESIKNPES